jgi:hypothetical protein
MRLIHGVQGGVPEDLIGAALVTDIFAVVSKRQQARS